MYPHGRFIYWLIQSLPKHKGLSKKIEKMQKQRMPWPCCFTPLMIILMTVKSPATHLIVLLRSQAWMLMNAALSRLADGIDGGEEIVRGFINDYYSSIKGSKDVPSLERYCDHFRKQMATWLIVPVLMAKMITTNEEFTNAIQTAYGSFGIAWRLLDDIKDFETDMMKGTKSSIYVCLPEELKNYWENKSGAKLDKKNGYCKVILDYILREQGH